MKFVLKKTCEACPSQWEGVEEESNRNVYVRYRWGELEVCLSTPEHPDGVWGECVVEAHFDDPFDGVMKNKELEELLTNRGHTVVFMNQTDEDNFDKAQKEYLENHNDSFYSFLKQLLKNKTKENKP